jgi:CheY-like chemotaxis protein
MQDVRESAFSNLLVVDDEPSIRIALVQMLTEIGYFVRSAKEGFSALREIRESTPDLIVSDLNMPGMSGFELLYVVRHRFPSIRVIAMCETSSIDEMRFGMADALYRKGSDTCSLLKLFEACPGRSGCLRTSPRLLHSAFNDTQAPPPENLTFRSTAQSACAPSSNLSEVLSAQYEKHIVFTAQALSTMPSPNLSIGPQYRSAKGYAVLNTVRSGGRPHLRPLLREPDWGSASNFPIARQFRFAANDSSSPNWRIHENCHRCGHFAHSCWYRRFRHGRNQF